MHEQPTHLDLFSGIGGFALAAGWAGFRTIAFSEIEPYPCAVLKRHWPAIPNVGDIRKLDGSRFAGVSLLTAGVPCQPASCAGKRKGKNDDRWLWPEALRILGEAKPEVAVFENPAGILALESGLVFERLLAQMEGLGYAVQPVPIPACAVGAKHPRNRVWIVAHLEEFGAGRLSIRSRQPQQAAAEPERLCTQGPAADAPQTRCEHDCEGSPRKEFAGRNAAASYDWPDFDPSLLRVVHGLPNRMDRVGALGNAIVPQVAYEILRAIRELI